MDSILTDKRRLCEHDFREEFYGFECSLCGHIQTESPWPEDYDDCEDEDNENGEYDEDEG